MQSTQLHRQGQKTVLQQLTSSAICSYLLDFGKVLRNDHQERTLTLRLPSNATSSVGFALGIAALQGSPFTALVEKAKTFKVTREDPVEVKIALNTEAVALDQCFNVVLPLHLVGGPSYNLTLRASVTDPALEATPKELTFGKVLCGTRMTMTVTLNNEKGVVCKWSAIMTSPRPELSSSLLTPVNLAPKLRPRNMPDEPSPPFPVLPVALGITAAVLILAAGLAWWFARRSRQREKERDQRRRSESASLKAPSVRAASRPRTVSVSSTSPPHAPIPHVLPAPATPRASFMQFSEPTRPATSLASPPLLPSSPILPTIAPRPLVSPVATRRPADQRARAGSTPTVPRAASISRSPSASRVSRSASVRSSTGGRRSMAAPELPGGSLRAVVPQYRPSLHISEDDVLFEALHAIAHLQRPLAPQNPGMGTGTRLG
ncbi:hypothetical protein AMAG_18289 [Allomyces macrogynus ATCC 38327]|uniref:Uncharacterized protein n=1 Tax=Allomyces macrogynus (strain ATCC 38327) TaxID=578462 RepID=A0A0L0S896_ALLM3|nr:hypothetical protein AMAG_18289 [Allomyces macrogynus ATCC 38327]|eukprot:KNE58651.1 hypothetical protein AMAG_18289 [Allomyces macrogynus ATCC 38327]